MFSSRRIACDAPSYDVGATQLALAFRRKTTQIWRQSCRLTLQHMNAINELRNLYILARRLGITSIVERVTRCYTSDGVHGMSLMFFVYTATARSRYPSSLYSDVMQDYNFLQAFAFLLTLATSAQAMLLLVGSGEIPTSRLTRTTPPPPAGRTSSTSRVSSYIPSRSMRVSALQWPQTP